MTTDDLIDLGLTFGHRNEIHKDFIYNVSLNTSTNSLTNYMVQFHEVTNRMRIIRYSKAHTYSMTLTTVLHEGIITDINILKKILYYRGIKFK